MELNQTYLEKFRPAATKPKSAARSLRDQLLEDILVRINKTRADDGFSPLTLGWVIKRVKGRDEQQLYRLFRECESARNFSKLFWFKTNLKKA